MKKKKKRKDKSGNVNKERNGRKDMVKLKEQRIVDEGEYWSEEEDEGEEQG